MSRPVNSRIKRASNALPRSPFTINLQSNQGHGLRVWFPITMPFGNGVYGLAPSFSVNLPLVTGSSNYQTLTNGLSGFSLSSSLWRISSFPFTWDINAPISFSAWIQTTQATVGDYLSTCDVLTSGGILCRINIDTSGNSGNAGNLAFQFVSQNTVFNAWNITSGLTLNDGLAHHVGMSYIGDGGGICTIVVDGQVVTSNVYGNRASWNGQSSSVLVGGNDGLLAPYTGLLADCRIYDRALSSAEFWALYDPATRYELYQQPRSFYGKAAAAPTGSRRGDFNISLGAV